MRKTNKRIDHLWKTYEKSRDHILSTDSGAHRHTKIHISNSSYPKATVLYTLLTCAAGVLISLLLINSPLLTQHAQSERTLDFSQRLSFLLVFNSLYLAAAVITLAIKNLLFRRLRPFFDLLILLIINSVFVVLSLLYSFQPVLFGLMICMNVTILIVGKLLLKNYSFAGLNFYLASCVGMIIGIVWGVHFFTNMPASFATKLILLCASPLLLVSLPSAFLRMLELYDIVCRERWRKIRHQYPHQLASDEPFVSIHMPTYSEPPDMVIETLNKLAAVHYKHYEVIVIDNNTKDPALWQPVQAHCAALGEKFRA